MQIGRGQFLLAAAVATLAYAAGLWPALAQQWPVRPVTLVVTFAAGSSDDILARIISSRLSDVLGQQVIVENVAGAGGMTGVSRVAKAAPDGYQFVLGGTGTFAANQTLYKHPLYNAMTDFAPVALVAEQPILLTARKELPAGNLKDFIAYAKSNRGRMQYGSGGVGSATHLGCVLLNSAAGIEATHIPYRAAAIALQDLIAERIDYLCPIASTAIALIGAGQIKAIANLSKTRSPILPDLATAQEQGLADFEAYFWSGLFMPKGTPAGVVGKLHDAVVMVMNDPAFRNRLKEIGADVVGPERRSPQYLGGLVTSEIEKWAGPIKASGVSMD